MFLSLATGCAGARGAVVFDDLHYPVSMSAYLDDGHGHRVGPDQYESLKDFRYDTRFWGILYSAVRLTGQKDISGPIDAFVRKEGGDGVVGLAVFAEGCPWNRVPLLIALPFWPGCTDVSVWGMIVKLKPPAQFPTTITPPARPEPAGGNP